MQHLGTQRLETPRLILRRFSVEDAGAMYENWASDEDVTRYLTWPKHASVSVTQAVLREWVQSYDRPDFYQWAIALKEDDRPIGSIAVGALDSRAEKAELGYCIGKRWWRQGYTSEALRAVLSFLFDEVGLGRIEARHDIRNPHSGQVMKTCGMRFEVTQRQAGWNNQGICDLSCYALLASERQ